MSKGTYFTNLEMLSLKTDGRYCQFSFPFVFPFLSSPELIWHLFSSSAKQKKVEGDEKGKFFADPGRRVLQTRIE